MTSTLQDIRLAELRFVTQQYINEQPTVITLIPTRGTSTQTAGGAHNYGPATPRNPQTFRLCARSIDSRGGGVIRSANDHGKAVEFEYDLIGLWTAFIEIGDTWDEVAPDGSKIHYHVESIQPANNYEVVALVEAWAVEPQHGDG
jgi:hypothetical protein